MITQIGEPEARIYHLADLNTEQIRALDHDKTAVLIPGGILEEHGPYLPCATDTIGSERVVKDLAAAIVRRHGWSALIFPTIPLGHGPANEIGGKHAFPGSFTVRATTVRAVLMDLATELGEQGFRWIFYVNQHVAPNEQQTAAWQACAYFCDTYGGKMVNLMGLLGFFSLLGDALTAEDQMVAPIDVHAGALETGWMLAYFPHLVAPAYKEAATQSGETWEEVMRIAEARDWPGYVGAPALAKASYGIALADKVRTMVNSLALRILDGEDIGAAPPDVLTPLQDHGWEDREQREWLDRNGLM